MPTIDLPDTGRRNRGNPWRHSLMRPPVGIGFLAGTQCALSWPGARSPGPGLVPQRRGSGPNPEAIR
jgi:hypothetical protein